MHKYAWWLGGLVTRLQQPSTATNTRKKLFVGIRAAALSFLSSLSVMMNYWSYQENILIVVLERFVLVKYCNCPVFWRICLFS